jgi:hypothetical protein
MLLVTIHQRPGNCHLGMQIVHNWLRKRPYALCRSCRGMLDLQLSYSNFCALQFKFLEKNPSQSRQAETNFDSGAPAPASSWPRRGRAGPARRDRPRSAGPRAVDFSNLRRTALLPLLALATRPRHAARPVVAPPYWPAPTHIAAAPPPTPRSVLLPPRLGVQGNTQPPRSSTTKAPHHPSREGTPHHRAAIAAHRCSR